MKICIITDAGFEQTNGVVTTIKNIQSQLEKRNYQVQIIQPMMFDNFSLFFYPEIKITTDYKKVILELKKDYDAYHICTEGPLGLIARNYLIKNKIPFTSSYHTKYDEYLQKFFKIPKSITRKVLKWFHGKSSKILVPTNSVKNELEDLNWKNIVVWGRGIDFSTFNFDNQIKLSYPSPIWLHVGRISKEKNIEEFLKLNLTGTKLVVGDGPHKKYLEEKYKDAIFVGKKTGKELASYYQGSDVFIFPSKTDTAGLVQIESMACGTPVTAYPVTGPLDFVKDGENGILNWDLKSAAMECLKISRKSTAESVSDYSWEKCADQFVSHLMIIQK